MRLTASPAWIAAPAAAGDPSGSATAAVRRAVTKEERRAAIAFLLFMAALVLKPVVDLDGVLAIGPLPLVSLSKLAGLAFLVCFILYLRAVRPTVRLDPLHLIVGSLLILAVASAVHAPETGTAAAAVFRYASYIALFVAGAHLLADTALQLRTVWAIVAASALAAVLSLRNVLSGQSMLATLPHGDVNDVAFTLATALPLAMWLAAHAYRTRAARPWRAYGAAALAAVCSAAIASSVALSLSRGALLAVAAAVALHLVRNRQQLRLAIAGAAAAVLVVVALVALNPGHILRGAQAKQNYAWANVTNRLSAWTAATEMALAHPWLGVGPSHFQFAYAERWQPGMQRLGVVHNSVLEIGAELGLPAMCLFVGFLALTWLRLTALAAGPEVWPGLAAALRSALLIASVAGMFISVQLLPPFWVLGALACGLWHALRPAKPAI